MNALITTLTGVFEAIEASDEVYDAFIFTVWRSIAGRQVSERTEPLAIEDKRLIIAVADKTWQRNLETLAPQLLFKLNASLGKPLIDFIEFRIDPTAIARPEEEESDSDSDVAPPPVELSISARKIRDEALRETVLKAAANCLARQK